MKVLASVLLHAALVMGQYCAGGNNIVGDSNLGAVALTGATLAINDAEDCPGATGVIDDTAQKVDLQPGGEYTLTYQVTTCGTIAYPRVTAAWVDFNNNQVYEENERLGDPVAIDRVLEPQAVSFPIVPPCDAVVGDLGARMRILVIEGEGAMDDPCQPYSYGGAKEFSIEILSTPGVQCGGKAIGGGMSFGWIFIMSTSIVLFLYIAVGCWYMRSKRHTTGCRESCMHSEQWASFFSLAKEGCAVTKNKLMGLMGKGDSSAYEDLGDGQL